MRAPAGGRSGRGCITIAAVGLAVVLAGCGAESGSFKPTVNPTMVRWARWDSLSRDSCWGSVLSGARRAANVELHFWYANGNAETVRVLPEDQAFPVPAQITRGEARFPRVGTITWDGGTWPEEPRAPVIWLGGPRPYWSPISVDSLQLLLGNNGGFAYHVTVTIEGRHGIETLHAVPDPIPFDRSAVVRAVPVNTSGSPVGPRILAVTWEDYGGIGDSTMAP